MAYPETIFAFNGEYGPEGGVCSQSSGAMRYVRDDLTPPAAVVEAMEKALRHADQVSRDLGWHRIYDETGAALADLEAWRAGK